MIIVTHDPQVAAQAERVIEIRDGEIVRNPPAIEKVNATGGTEPVVNTASGWRQFVSGFNEALTMAWRALAANKMRTLLTMLGIIIRYRFHHFHRIYDSGNQRADQTESDRCRKQQCGCTALPGRK